MMILIFALGAALRCHASPRIVVLMVPGLAASDLAAPELSAIQKNKAARGWMLCRAARTPDRTEGFAAQCLTLGAGSRAAVPANLPLAIVKKGSGASLSPQTLTELRAANSRVNHAVSLGAVGDLLHRARRLTAVIGTRADNSADPSPFLFAMDSNGTIDHWHPHTIRPNPSMPYGIADDLETLSATLNHLPAAVNLAVIVFGDLDRADRYAPFCLPSVAAQHRQAARTKFNLLLTALLSRQKTGDRIVVLSPAPAESVASRFDRITPIWISTPFPSHELNGVLVSASTRRRGIVLNTDLLPTIARWLDLPVPPNTLGRPLGVKPSTQFDTGEWTELHTKLTKTARKQNLFGGLPTVQLLFVLGAVFAAHKRKTPVARALASGILVLPLLLLLLPRIAPWSPVGSGILLAAALGALMFLAAAKPFASLGGYFCALLAATIFFDLGLALSLLQDAWMSYSVMEGARFYGIGNEYMGATIGALCAFWGMQRANSPRAFGAFCVFFALLIILMGVPSAGAKVGAIPSAGFALGVMIVVRRTGGFRLHHLMILLSVLGLGLVLLALWDSRHAVEGQSHFARAVSGSGGGSLLDIALRKLQMEGTLLMRSPWSLTLWASALGFGFLRSRLKEVHSNLRTASAGIIAGAVASLLFNDAGVLAAALIVLFGAAMLCLEMTQNANLTSSNPTA
jgi:hypothetical protein